MIIVTFNTVYLTVDAFLDRYDQFPPGAPFSYATGDLANACVFDEPAGALRDLVHKLEETKKIALTQKRRPDLTMKGGGAAFEYFATKRRPKNEVKTTP